MCVQASVQCWLAAAGPWWWWRLITQYTVEPCHTGTKASVGKCCGLLCMCVCVCMRVWCISFSSKIFSITALHASLLPFFFSSRLWLYTLQPLPRGTLSGTIRSVYRRFTRFFGTGSSWRRQNKSELKEWCREQKAAAAAGVESGFYCHKSLLWWGILSNGNFFLTGGVIAFSLWTPLDIYTPSCTNAFLCTQTIGSSGWCNFCSLASRASFLDRNLGGELDMLLSWMHGSVKRWGIQNIWREINDDTACHVVALL